VTDTVSRSDLLSLSGEPFEVPGTPEVGSAGRSRSRRVLMLLDLSMIVLASAVAVLVVRGGDMPKPAKLLSLAAVDVLTVAIIASQRLYRARVCAVRSVEIVRLSRAVFMAALCGLALDRVFTTFSSLQEVGLRTGIAALGLIAGRGAFRSWLHTQRRNGRCTRPVIIVGTGDEAFDLYRRVLMHPELGYDVRGVVGPPVGRGGREMKVPWLGDLPEVVPALRRCGANGALIATSDVSVNGVNSVVPALLAVGAHVHLSSGLRGIYHRRVVSQPLGYEPLLYLEQRGPLSGIQWSLKRLLDLVLGSIAFMLSLPVIAVAVIAIKLCDRGPVIFTQQRVGRFGKPFTLYKLRTMQTDAEQRLAEFQAMNQRTGPLFKLADDPRVTRVGRFLRAASIDELPQLLNVLRGQMSLVGPRPALLIEVAQFESSLETYRHSVPPGITGLWQVEARDDPSFGAYEHWDAFYVANWSVLLDLAILLATAQRSVGRVTRFLRTGLWPRRRAAANPVIVLD
jgi:exopolysaccharide biosynthesis polyprenyl glycosylphosphotransferase